MTSELKRQFTFRVSQANPTEMIVILYDMTLQYLTDAGESAGREEIAEYRENVRRARNCVSELLQSLHLEYEPAAPCGSCTCTASADCPRRRHACTRNCCRRWKTFLRRCGTPIARLRPKVPQGRSCRMRRPCTPV